MGRGPDRLMAYRTMRAVERANQPETPVPDEKKSLWQRWCDRVNKTGDKLLGSK